VCGQAAYCNTTCQRSAWPSHKNVCPAVLVQGSSLVTSRNISAGQIVTTASPLLYLDRSDPTAFSKLYHQFQVLDNSSKLQICNLFDDQDVYKTLETPALRENQDLQAFLLTISLEQFETLMKVIQVMCNFGILYEKFCLLFLNLKIDSKPNCAIEQKLGTGSLLFNVRAGVDVKRGVVVTVEKKPEKNNVEGSSVQNGNAKTEKDIEVVFKALDCDSDGYLSKNEFENALNLIKLFSKEEADDLFIKADHDCDGKIGMEDFLRFVKKYR